MPAPKLFATSLLLGLLTCPTPTDAQVTSPIASSQLQNLAQLKDEIRAYYANGSYDREVSDIESDATRYVDQRVAAGVKAPAVVLDIDDTALSTTGYELDHDFAYDRASWNAYAASPGFPAIGATLAFAKHVQSEGVSVFFVTGRRVPETSVTIENLKAAGYAYAHLYLRPVDERAASVVPFKSGERAQIEQAGYTVLETIGDQWSDLEGGHAERAYKLPNPMYFIP
ncbi:MAG: HAD family acid phosphatase [Candidatus Eremiobacteraeota bacterium]|nr:HAD family acid phosphatase [Candidatus Eremiobacteraeota bacterium]